MLTSSSFSRHCDHYNHGDQHPPPRSHDDDSAIRCMSVPPTHFAHGTSSSRVKSLSRITGNSHMCHRGMYYTTTCASSCVSSSLSARITHIPSVTVTVDDVTDVIVHPLPCLPHTQGQHIPSSPPTTAVISTAKGPSLINSIKEDMHGSKGV